VIGFMRILNSSSPMAFRAVSYLLLREFAGSDVAAWNRPNAMESTLV
jgi:hypothetical protein